MSIEDGPIPVTDDPISNVARLREIEAVMARRLDSVERENLALRTRQRAHWIVTAVVAGVALVTMMLLAVRAGPNHVAERLQAREFVLRSATGVERGVWESSADGQISIALRDDAGRERLRMALLPDGSPGVTLSDERGRTRAVVGALADGSTNLVIADRQGRTRVVLGQSARDDISLLMADGDGATRAVLGLDPSGEADFSIFRHGGPAEPDPAQPDSLTVADTETAGAAGTR